MRELINVFGTEPAEVRERTVGEPARRSRRLVFASGGEIILHDDAVVAVVFRLTSTLTAARGLDLSKWIAGVGNDATLDDLAKAVGARPRFAGLKRPYFEIDGGYLQPTFTDEGWKKAGNLVGVTVVADRPGLACRPEDDDCRICGDLLVRASEPGGGVDVDGTIVALGTALTSGLLKEDPNWVRLDDLRMLHAAGLMERVESQITCMTCTRIICFTLFRDRPPTFGYHVFNDARQRPLEAIPPVEQWGDDVRITAAREAMRYVDHGEGAWFLVEQKGAFYLQARYIVTSMVDDSALIRLDDTEAAAYRGGGHEYLSELAARIHDNGPHRETSPYRERDLFRGVDREKYREAVTRAIVNHTWLARQRRPG